MKKLVFIGLLILTFLAVLWAYLTLYGNKIPDNLFSTPKPTAYNELKSLETNDDFTVCGISKEDIDAIPVSEFNWDIPEIPSLPEDAEWITSSTDENSYQMSEYNIYYSNNLDFDDPDKIIAEEITTQGIIYEALVKGDKNFGYDFMDDFTKNLMRRGWNWKLQYGNYEITGVSADSVQGSLIGYLKRNGNLVRTITVSYTLAGEWDTDVETGMPYPKPPYLTRLNIYINEPVDLNTLLPGCE